jgi:orotidine-5'-phosphate decarboxylase
MPPRDRPEAMADRLIVALDVPTVAAAERLAAQLQGTVSFFKIGLWLLFAPGVDQFIGRLLGQGNRVFLDAKMYDIGETVRQGVQRATENGVSLVTVHGDPQIMRAAVDGKKGSTSTKIFAISVLTSLNDSALREMGYALSVHDLVRLRVRQAVECGCDGIIASADDNPDEMRRTANAQHLLVATPGIREPGRSLDDHSRHATPAQAIARGADYLVVGRPITRADDPVAAATRIIADMARGSG